jgi:hypothetical protein
MRISAVCWETRVPLHKSCQMHTVLPPRPLLLLTPETPPLCATAVTSFTVSRVYYEDILQE